MSLSMKPLVSRRFAAMLGVHFGDGRNGVFDMRGHDGSSRLVGSGTPHGNEGAAEPPEQCELQEHPAQSKHESPDHVGKVVCA